MNSYQSTFNFINLSIIINLIQILISFINQFISRLFSNQNLNLINNNLNQISSFYLNLISHFMKIIFNIWIYIFFRSVFISLNSFFKNWISLNYDLIQIKIVNQIKVKIRFKTEINHQKYQKKKYSFFNIKKLSHRSEFKNFYVNEIKIWKYEMNFFYIICEKLNHVTKNCQKKKLKNWKRSHFRIFIYENRKINSVFVKFDEFNFSKSIFLISVINDFFFVICFNSVCVKFSFEIKSSSVNNSIQSFLEKKRI